MSRENSFIRDFDEVIFLFSNVEMKRVENILFDFVDNISLRRTIELNELT
jgi:hypothetical protein